MTYKINGVEIAQPTIGRWMRQDPLGINGFGQSIYPGVREFEMRWVLQSPSEYNAIQGYFNTLGNTGTAIVDLPEYGAATYAFKSYTGCVFDEPEFGRYFTEYQSEVILRVRNIRT